jgi:hypothetical protein
MGALAAGNGSTCPTPGQTAEHFHDGIIEIIEGGRLPLKAYKNNVGVLDI